MSVLSITPISISESESVQRLSAGVIQGLPLLDQLHEPTADQLADENARMNCVFTSFAMVARKIGHPITVSGDDVKDKCSNYGQGYVGGADAEVVARDGCLDKNWGIHCDTVHYSNRQNMLNACMVYSDKGQFVEVTIPSAWGSQPSQPGYNPDDPNFWTHACIYCGYFGDTHVLANPWGGFLMYYSSADLTARLCYLKIYPISPVTLTPVVTTMNAQQVSAVASAAGFSGNALDVAVAIAHAESGFNPSAKGYNKDAAGNVTSVDRGLWQINSHYHSEVSDACAFDPSCCAKAAYTISNGGTDWTPWSTYNSGAYKQYLGEAVTPVIILDEDASGNVTGAHDATNTALTVGSGVAKAIKKNNQLDHHIVDLGGTGRRGERSFGARTATVLSNDASPDSVYTYSAQFGVIYALGCPDLAIILSDRIRAADIAATPPPPPPKPDYTGELKAVQDAVNALEGALMLNGEVK